MVDAQQRWRGAYDEIVPGCLRTGHGIAGAARYIEVIMLACPVYDMSMELDVNSGTVFLPSGVSYDEDVAMLWCPGA